MNGQAGVSQISAAEERAALAALGHDLSRGRDAGRADALIAPRSAPPAAFSDLHLAPAWLRRSPDALRNLARRASVQSAAATLAASIDGALLGHVARVCGEKALDDAITAATALDDRPIPSTDAIEADGIAILAAALPASLRAYLPAGGGCVTPFADAGRARSWVERAAS